MKLITMLALIAFLSACSQTAAPLKNEAAVVSSAVASAEANAKGKMLYEENCSSCHKLKNPEWFSEEKLRTIVPKMAKNAKIDTETESLILNYMVATTNAQAK